MSAGKENSLVDSLKAYALKRHYHDIKAILMSCDLDQHYAISVHAMSLFEYSVEFAYYLFKNAEKALKLLDQAFKKAALSILDQESALCTMKMKENIHTRMTSLPSCPEIYRTILPKCSDVGQFLCISGTIIRVTMPKMMEYRRRWKCTKCKFQFDLDVEPEQDFLVLKPSRCENLDTCYNKTFSLVSCGVNATWCRDYQEVRVQEQVHNLVVGTVPRSMWVILENELVDSCQAGNDVIISGVVHTRWQPLAQGMRSDIELILIAHNVEVKNNNIAVGSVSEESLKEFKEFWLRHQNSGLQGRDFILSCFCPQVFGLYIVKLAVALVLAGGVPRVDNANSRIRGDSHLLLVGDPGTGKSQFLKYAAKVSRRSVLTSGIGTTNAGLTVAAVKDGGKWQLEAGALVLADGGICCIDEFNCIKEQDKASIHEAMEQQTISVAKAGLVCKLSTQCSILAATNPKGKYNKNESLSANTAMASPLLSRFDIIIVLLDTYNEEWDKLVSSYILEGKDMALEYGSQPAWSIEKMRTYFSAIRNIKPNLTPECDRVLQAYYKRQRSLADRSAARTTPRLLQSLIRLAQGHARLMFRLEVLVMDAIVAITVMESSMQGFGLFQNSGALHTTFPDDPEAVYKEQASTILKQLYLEDLLIQEIPPVEAGAAEDAVVMEILTQIDPYSRQQWKEQSPENSKKLSNYNSTEKSPEQRVKTFDANRQSQEHDMSAAIAHAGLDAQESPQKTVSGSTFDKPFRSQTNRAQNLWCGVENSTTFSNHLNDYAQQLLNSHPMKVSFLSSRKRDHSEDNSQVQRKKKSLFEDRFSSTVQCDPHNALSVENHKESPADEASKAFVSQYFSDCEERDKKKQPGFKTNSGGMRNFLRKRVPLECQKEAEGSDMAHNMNEGPKLCAAEKVRNDLSNNVSTLSELNAIFNEDVFVDNSPNRKRMDFSKLKQFAFKPKCTKIGAVLSSSEILDAHKQIAGVERVQSENVTSVTSVSKSDTVGVHDIDTDAQKVNLLLEESVHICDNGDLEFDLDIDPFS